MFDVALIEQCKNPNVDTQIVQQIIHVESRSNKYAINVNSKGKSIVSLLAKSKEEASGAAKDYIKQGYSVDLGLMQFNSNNLGLKIFKHLDVDSVLEPCANIKAGSDIFYYAYESTNPEISKKERLLKALSIYNTGNDKKGFINGYVARYKIDDTSTPVVKQDNTLADMARRSDTRIEISYKTYNLEYFKKLP